jgi:hypothetical protein
MSPQSTIKWPCQGLPGSRSWAIWRFMKPYTRDSSNNRLRQTLGPWTRPDQRIWPVYYLSSQMLCQMVQTPQHETATPGTANTSWQYYPAGIASTRRFIAVSKDAASFQDSRLRLTLFRSRFSLKHLPYSGVPFRHCRPRLGMTRYEIRKLQRSRLRLSA